MAASAVVRAALLFLGSLLFAAHAAVEQSVPAVQKVIQLLTDMSTQAVKAKNEEAVEYAKFEQFCKDTTASKTVEIKEGAELIEVLSADIEKLGTDIEGLQEKLEELQNTISKAQADMKKNEARREKEKAANREAISEHLEAVDSLERAITVLQKQNYDRKQAADALLQISGLDIMPGSAQRTVAAFLEMQTGDDFLTRENPEANAYEFQSGHIIELLKKFLVEFTEKRDDLQKQEMSNQHNFELLQQQLTDIIENAESDTADNTAHLQEKKATRADKSKRLDVATKGHAEDVKYLSNLEVECREKAASFQEKQGLRDEEVQAIQKAIEIMNSEDVMGNAEKHLPAAAASSLQLSAGHPSAFAQLRSGSSETPAVRMALTSYLKAEGQRLHSSRLSMLAHQVASSADPFGKVKKLIQDLITRLLQEANEEAEHKGWCDTELGTNKKTRDKLTADIDKLQARIDEDQASIMEMTERIAELAKETQEIVQEIKEVSALRATEMAKNKATIEDAASAQKAISAATVLLKEFYKKASTATALVQDSPIQYDRIGNEEVKMGSAEWNALANPNAEEVDRGHREGMQTFGKTYRGQQDEAGGVLAMLEVIASDFASLESDTVAAEELAISQYNDFMAESNKNKAVKAKETSMLSSDKLEAEERMSSDTKDIKSTQDQLLAADRYYEKLKPQCIDQGVTYEQRAKARADEIQSLQEALRILSSET